MKYENQGKEHEVCNISSNVTLLQKCENNITLNYFSRSYSKLMLNKINIMWKELLSFIHFMGRSSKTISKYFKQIQDVSKYFELTQNISTYLQIYQENFFRPFCLHYGWTLYEFHPWWCWGCHLWHQHNHNNVTKWSQIKHF